MTKPAIQPSLADVILDRHANAFADAMPQIVWTANPDGWLDYYNQHWVDYTGMSVEQTQGWGWGPVLHPDDLQQCIDVWTHSVRTGAAYEVEYRFKRASDGQYRWHLGRALPVRDEQGLILKWFGTCTDIQDQKEAQALVERTVAERTTELAQANAQLRKQIEERRKIHERQLQDTQRLNQIIATQSVLATAELELETFFQLVVERLDLLTPSAGTVIEMLEGDEMVYHAASGVAARHLGLRLGLHSSLSGLCVKQREVLLCEDAEHDPRVDAAACRQLGIRSMIVAPLFHRREAVGVIKAMGAPASAFDERDVQTLQLMAGLIGAAIGNRQAFQDKQTLLEDLQAASDATKASEQRARTIVESSLDAFVAIDIQGRITDWNHEAELTFGWSHDEAIGQAMAELIVPERFRQAHSIGMTHYRKTGEGPILGQRIQLQANGRNGREFPVELTINAVQHGQEQAFCAFLHDITERREAENRLTHMAQHDQLTGLPNRTLFNDRLEHAMARSKRSKHLMALMYVDVDGFKDINDAYGHSAGDELLAEFAARLRRSVRSADTVARFGGDEFLVLAEELQVSPGAIVLTEKIMDGLRDKFSIAGRLLKITASLGGVFYNGEEISAEELIRSADQQLYRAKASGRNRGCWPD